MVMGLLRSSGAHDCRRLGRTTNWRFGSLIAENQRTLRFRSKIDAWLIVPVAIGVSIPAIIGISRLLAGRPGSAPAWC